MCVLMAILVFVQFCIMGLQSYRNSVLETLLKVLVNTSNVNTDTLSKVVEESLDETFN